MSPTSKPAKNPLLRRLRMFASTPTLQWGDTAFPLDEQELKSIKHRAALEKRLADEIAARGFELGSLRKRIAQKRLLDEQEQEQGPKAEDGEDGEVGALSSKPASLPPRFGRSSLSIPNLGLVKPAAEGLAGQGKSGAVHKRAQQRRQYMSTQDAAPLKSREIAALPVVVAPFPEALEMLRFADTDVSDEAARASPQAQAQGAFYVEQESKEVLVQAIAAGVSVVTDAAMCVAQENFMGAESCLRQALEDPGEHSRAAQQEVALAWLDLLNIADREADFQAHAQVLHERLGIRAPAYRPRRLSGAAKQRFNAQASLSVGDALSLRGVISAYQTGTAGAQMQLGFVRLDWIEAGAAAELALALAALNGLHRPFVFMGATRLYDALAARALAAKQANQLELADLDAQLELARLLNMREPFLQIAAVRGKHFGSAPQWQAPTAQFKSYADPAQAAANANLSLEPEDGANRERSVVWEGVIRVEEADELLAELRTTSVAVRSVRLEMAGLLRLDFAAAVALLNWLETAFNERVDVQLVGASPLNAALLDSLGAQSYAIFK